MDKCTCCHSATAYQQKIQPWAEQISAAQTAKIKENFASAKALNDGPIALKGVAASGVASSAPLERGQLVVKLNDVKPYYTGYARIDNAITDALCGKSQELKDNVYTIIWQDLLPNNVHGLEEADRTALISLGVQKAEYLAEQFIDEKDRDSFMEAMRSIAKIGMEGKRVGSCDMEYQVKHTIGLDGNNHVLEDNMSTYLFTMEREAPETYQEYQKLRKASENGEVEAAFFALKWAMSNLNLIAANKPKHDKLKDEQYEKLQKVELDDTFSQADTSSKERFLASLAEILKQNPSLQAGFFLNRISGMSKTMDDYLIGRQLLLSGKV